MKTHIIPAAHGFAFEVKKGERFRVVDLLVFANTPVLAPRSRLIAWTAFS